MSLFGIDSIKLQPMHMIYLKYVCVWVCVCVACTCVCASYIFLMMYVCTYAEVLVLKQRNWQQILLIARQPFYHLIHTDTHVCACVSVLFWSYFQCTSSSQCYGYEDNEYTHIEPAKSQRYTPIYATEDSTHTHTRARARARDSFNWMWLSTEQTHIIVQYTLKNSLFLSRIHPHQHRMG